jgi:hypothetical protein
MPTTKLIPIGDMPTRVKTEKKDTDALPIAPIRELSDNGARLRLACLAATSEVCLIVPPRYECRRQGGLQQEGIKPQPHTTQRKSSLNFTDNGEDQPWRRSTRVSFSSTLLLVFCAKAFNLLSFLVCVCVCVCVCG